MPKRDMLLEIGCEELPAREPLITHLAEKLTNEFKLHQLNYSKVITYATPRRLAVCITEIDEQQPAQQTTRLGPAVEQAFDRQGKPTTAAIGFAQSCGVSVDSLSSTDTPKGKRLYFSNEQPGKPTIELIPALVQRAIAALPITRPMRWGTGAESFARPVHWVVLLFGREVIKTTLFELISGNQTYGHRYHHPQSLTIPEPQAYATMLAEQGYVIADFNQRSERIRQQIKALTPKDQTAVMDQDLLEEVIALVEWPQALLGHFNPDFLQIPQEVLITSMQTNQRYFPILKQNRLQPAFILISNIQSKNPATVIQGNERVLNARLTDAAFFYKNDCQHSLESRLPHLGKIIFQKQLGTVAEKIERMVTLAGLIAEQIGADSVLTRQAAQLAKCDLVSEMVSEFPNLQGIMGFYFALNDGIEQTGALAIKEHYNPRFAGDSLPSNKEGCAVALADKLDTLVGIFGINQPPTGDKDPFALRRAANGVLAILLEKKLSLDLIQLLQQAQRTYSFHLPNSEVIPQVFDFMMNRLKSMCLEKGVTSDQFEAVLTCKPTVPLDFIRRIDAVCEFQKLPAANVLAAANKRVSNILKKQAADFQPGKLEPALFESAAEQELAQHLERQTAEFTRLYQQADYTAALKSLAALKDPVDNFFNHVMVMVDDQKKRSNRLTLLTMLHQLFTQVADISLL